MDLPSTLKSHFPHNLHLKMLPSLHLSVCKTRRALINLKLFPWTANVTEQCSVSNKEFEVLAGYIFLPIIISYLIPNPLLSETRGGKVIKTAYTPLIGRQICYDSVCFVSEILRKNKHSVRLRTDKTLIYPK